VAGCVNEYSWLPQSTHLPAISVRNDDVHHLLCLNSESYVASCGRELYRTDDVGRTWNCLDTNLEQFWHFYHREAITYEGQLYTAALDTARAKIY